jgi:1,4-alpha-glucan branching enzyme
MNLNDRIGAWLTPAGCFFRVWAPHAANVAVILQDGPYWEVTDTVIRQNLVNNGGYWSATVPGVKAYQMYRFEIRTPGGAVFQQLDAAGREVLDSDLTRDDPSDRNASIVLGSDPFPWTPFTTPQFENFIIYQCHIGTFAGWNDQFNKSWASLADVESKLGYIRDLGFSCIQPLPVQEFSGGRSWGYDPASYFSPETLYGSPYNLQHFVDAAHRQGLAVFFDVVYNHTGPADNSLWQYDGYANQGGIYYEGGQNTDWGIGPAWQKPEVQDYFYQNARMYLEYYNADGLRFDATTQINGDYLKLVMARLRQDFPNKYFVAEHLPDNPWIINEGRFCATWASRSHFECQRALNGEDSLNKINGILGWDGYDNAWNLVKYTLGSQDCVGDQNDGNAENGLTDWDSAHRYLVDKFGGRENWWGKAKCRLAWALNIAMPGTPMLFMGSECHMASPFVAWGYWDDGPDSHGDHRFNWDAAGDPTGMEMRRLVAACNAVRWNNPALRADSLTVPHQDTANQVLGFVRELYGNVVLVVVNMSEQNFTNYSYGVRTGGYAGQWTQILCTQDATFGGWDGAGNAFYEPWTQGDGQLYINLPKWSVVIFSRKAGTA